MKIADYERLFRDRDERILPHPHDEHSLVRQCRVDMPREDPRRVVNYTKRHLAMLAACGVVMPAFSFHVVPPLTPKKERHTNAEAFAVVERLGGLTLTEALKDTAESQPATVALEGLKISLHRYADWASSQPYVLRDIYTTGQYHFGATTRLPDEPNKIILHDIEPLLMVAGREYVGTLIDTLEQY